MRIPSSIAHPVEAVLQRGGHLLHAVLPTPSDTGMDPDCARICAAGALPLDRLHPRVMRVAAHVQAHVWNRPREQAVSVSDERVGRHVTVRTYVPHVESGGGLVYLHGGGGVIGDLDTHDRFARWIAVRSGMVVHAVDYRLAPEHPPPAAVLDVIAAWNHVHAGWVAQGRRPSELGVGGDSAGAMFSAVLANESVQSTLGVPVAGRPGFLVLLYPGLDTNHPDRGGHPDGVLLTDGVVDFFTAHYVGDLDPTSTTISPGLVGDEVLEQWPPTIHATVGFDPLLPENETFRARLVAAGVDLTVLHEPTLPHDFIQMTGVSQAAEDFAARLIDTAGEVARRP